MDYKSRILGKIEGYERKRENERIAGYEEDIPPEKKKKPKKRSADTEEWTEAQIQRAIASVLNKLKLCWCHVPNEGRRNKISGYMLKAAGLKKGCPDILIFSHAPAQPEARGVAIELKKSSGGKVSPEQKEWLRNLDKLGWYTEVCNGYEATMNTLEKLGFLKKKEDENGNENKNR